jgi:hypothetical protein
MVVSTGAAKVVKVVCLLLTGWASMKSSSSRSCSSPRRDPLSVRAEETKEEEEDADGAGAGVGAIVALASFTAKLCKLLIFRLLFLLLLLLLPLLLLLVVPSQVLLKLPT